MGINQYRFGVNYTPTYAWYYCWNDFQADAIAKDLDGIVELGADHIRVMLIWPYFQPNPRIVSQVHLERLGTEKAFGLPMAGGCGRVMPLSPRKGRVPEAEIAIPAICDAIRESARVFKVPIPAASEILPQSMLSVLMKNWAELTVPKPNRESMRYEQAQYSFCIN